MVILGSCSGLGLWSCLDLAVVLDLAAVQKQHSAIQISPMTKPLKGPQDELSIDKKKEIKDKVVKWIAVPKMSISALTTYLKLQPSKCTEYQKTFELFFCMV